MTKTLPLFLLFLITLVVSYKTLYLDKEESNVKPVQNTTKTNLQEENKLIEEMMGIENKQQETVKIPTH